jgi:hypothetical protein
LDAKIHALRPFLPSGLSLSHPCCPPPLFSTIFPCSSLPTQRHQPHDRRFFTPEELRRNNIDRSRRPLSTAYLTFLSMQRDRQRSKFQHAVTTVQRFGRELVRRLRKMQTIKFIREQKIAQRCVPHGYFA